MNNSEDSLKIADLLSYFSSFLSHRGLWHLHSKVMAMVLGDGTWNRCYQG